MLTLPTATVDLDTLRVFRDGVEHRLTAQEGQILEVLAAHQGATVTREVLLEEAMGISPKVVTRALDAAISRLRSKLEPTPRKPVSLISVRGKGYRLVIADAPSHAGVPTPDDGVIGREEETQQGLTHLAVHGRVLLLGPGGVGKTTLADRLLVRRLGPDGAARRLDLSQVETAPQLLPALGLGLGLATEATVDRVRMALDHSDGTWALDNLEQLDAEACQLLHEVVSPIEASLVLTSRRAPWSGLPTVELGGLPPQLGAVVVARASHRASPSTPVDVESLQALVSAVDGLPLALELLGAQLPRLGEGVLRASLEDGLLDLEDGRGGRHASLGSVVAGSWAQVRPEARRVLCWWSAFRGAFDLEDAQALLPPDAPPLTSVLDELTRLSLVVVQGDEVQPWAVVHAFAASQLSATDRESRDAALHRHLVARCPDAGWHDATVRLAHRSWVLARLEELAAAVPHVPAAERSRLLLSLLMAEHHLSPADRARWEDEAEAAATEAASPSLRAATLLTRLHQAHWSLPAAAALQRLAASEAFMAQAPRGLQLELAYARGLYLRRCSRMDEALAVLRSGAEDADDVSPSLAARFRQEVGVVLRRLGAFDEAATHLHRAMAMHRALNEPRFEAGCHISLASIHRQQGDDERALHHAQRAVDLARSLDLPLLLANALNNLANVQAQLGMPEAIDTVSASVKLSREQGDRPGLCVSVGGLAMFRDMAGDVAEAESAYEEARAHARIAGYADRAAYWTYRLGDLAHRQGRLPLAERRYREGIEGLDKVRSPHRLRVRALLALLVAERGDLDGAEDLLKQVAPLTEGEEDDKLFAAVARAGVARFRGLADPAAAFEELGVTRTALQQPLYFTVRAIYERSYGV